ncbi:MAG: hypothetical protein KAI76_09050 [Alphaproteobacteria bacterium]|nr:hypothetical protein [Alphaproteobacteria bacterium]
MNSSSRKDGTELMTDMKKFLFDTNDFNNMKSKTDIEIYTEEQMVQARTNSFELGRAEGLKDARLLQEERLAELLQKALGIVDKLVQDEDRREVEKCIGATKLAIKIAHKLVPRFAVQYALHEIESVVVQSVEARQDEPRIAVTVPSAHLDALKTRMDALVLEKGYAGKVIMIADDSLSPTDCRVEWADGGVERLYERLFTQIENEFTKSIACMEATIE